MDNREVKLSVNNLKISFRTDGGKVQAVRDISFNLYKGETLAIVGESGSGKSVTNRAIMGILANNAIKDGGEIIYDGRDLMKIPEEQFHKLRGDKISMIFQDPMSSLNPIMRVGKQLTEAMLIKGKVSQRESRRDFNATLKCANNAMDEARGAQSAEIKAENKQKCNDFDKFERKHLELENAYNKAHEAAEDAIIELDDALFRIEKNVHKNLRHDVAHVADVASHSFNTYVVNARAEELKALLEEIKLAVKIPLTEQVSDFARQLLNLGKSKRKSTTDWENVANLLKKVREILAEAVAFTMPNFFAMGYYVTFSEEPLPEMSVEELNKFLRKYLDDNFMLDFIKLAEEGIKYSATRSVENKKNAIGVIEENLSVFESEVLDKKQAHVAAKNMIAAVENAIDRLEVIKDNLLYTFSSSLTAAVNMYFDGVIRNAKEEKRFAKQTASYEKKVEAGKTPSWKVADKDLVDLNMAREDIKHIALRVREKLEKDVAASADIDFDARTVGLIDYLKEKACGVAYKVTRRMAKNRALKLLEEVGIPEPRKRYRQYPFEFSGGMRQRIVIAIALSANPDILICDEPTTALDVTIQSQILELINKVKVERQLSVIFITHDLGVVANMADRVAVMYAGKIVEIGNSEDIFYSPAHPYTWALLSSMPDLDTKEKLEAIPGTPPNMIYPPKGDAFADRNKYALQIDFEQQPPMFKISDTHYAATWLLHPDAPKVDPPKAVTDRIARMKKRDVAVDEPAAPAVEEAPVKKPAVKKTAAKTTKTSAAKTTAKKVVKKTGGKDNGKQ